MAKQTQIILVTTGTEVEMEPADWIQLLMEKLVLAKGRYRAKQVAVCLHMLIEVRDDLNTMIEALEAVHRPHR